MPAVWAATDASLILLSRSDTFKKVLPSKMFEAMGVGYPDLVDRLIRHALARAGAVQG